MGKISSLLTTALVVVSLASCSKESYTFQNKAPYGATYTAATTAAPVTETAAAEAPVAVATPELTASATKPAAVKHTARTYAAHAQAAKTVAAAETKAAPTKAEIKEAKATLKAMHKAAKKANPASPLAGGKSQLVAALLCFFLGGLGVHRFYLGYTGRGLLYIALAVTSFLIVPAIVLLVLVIIDLVKILTGSLQPKGGSYETTL
ncbi:TM2 domain-containing protein [Hymenobacter busanensis]|uniref:TM2 domain-containing protein n=1 Tax=Hymenobacter busanensis TaxID=2607656 RepID=A0A7L5A4T5_9BACT|nr:TM2 domain-containing protein [Hymenobacter busanensis]KAA9338276.1 TM2 domain-containing protein [Hymenobacter busanensis]QHJ09300.1 NINE protein [Hymenobacter busanensis]